MSTRRWVTHLVVLVYSLFMAVRMARGGSSEEAWLLCCIFSMLVVMREDGLAKSEPIVREKR